MKKQKIIAVIGYVSLFIGSVFNLINAITEKEIFPNYITIPLFLLAIVGIVCNIIVISKETKERKSSSKGEKT